MKWKMLLTDLPKKMYLSCYLFGTCVVCVVLWIKCHKCGDISLLEKEQQGFWYIDIWNVSNLLGVYGKNGDRICRWAVSQLLVVFLFVLMQDYQAEGKTMKETRKPVVRSSLIPFWGWIVLQVWYASPLTVTPEYIICIFIKTVLHFEARLMKNTNPSRSPWGALVGIFL